MKKKQKKDKISNSADYLLVSLFVSSHLCVSLSACEQKKQKQKNYKIPQIQKNDKIFIRRLAACLRMCFPIWNVYIQTKQNYKNSEIPKKTDKN